MTNADEHQGTGEGKAAPKPSLTIVEIAIDALKPDPANPRKISDQQLEVLTRAIPESGFIEPIVVRAEDNMIVGGHQRVRAARRLGYRTLPAVMVDLPIEKARLLNVTLNKAGGEFDTELLAPLLADLAPVEDIDLSLSGFSDDELKKLLKNLDARDKKERIESFDLEAALDVARAAPRAQRGQIWELGDHRLMCGDSTDPTDVDRLFADEKASLLASDPPYLVDYDSGEKAATNATRGRTKERWDDYHDAESAVEFYRKFLRAALPHLRPNTPEVFTRPLEYHTEIGDVVYEPFSGSGSQIIAAERLSRRCFAMELESHYVDVAIYRWEAFTEPGGKARGMSQHDSPIVSPDFALERDDRGGPGGRYAGRGVSVYRPHVLLHARLEN